MGMMKIEVREVRDGEGEDEFIRARSTSLLTDDDEDDQQITEESHNGEKKAHHLEPSPEDHFRFLFQNNFCPIIGVVCLRFKSTWFHGEL